MNAVAEALGLSLPGCAAIPAPYRERGQIAYETGRRIVEMAYEDLRPSKILTRESFLNAIAVIAAIGGSTNAQPHLVAMARHAGVEITPDGLDEYGYDLPLLVEHAAGRQVSSASASTAPAACRRCCAELLRAGSSTASALTVTGRRRSPRTSPGRDARDREVIRALRRRRCRRRPASWCSTGNLFDFAIMKTSVISEEFRQRYLSRPGQEGVFEARAVVFDGSDDYHAAHQRSRARHRRELHPGDPRRRADRLAGLGRSGQHAAAGRAAPARHH